MYGTGTQVSVPITNQTRPVMKQCIALLTGCLIYWGAAPAQQPDSLRAALAVHTQEDTIRLDLLNSLSYLYYQTDPEQGIHTATEALLLAGKLNRPEGRARAYRNRAINYWSQGRDTLALRDYAAALALYTESGNRNEKAKVYNGLALVYYNLGDFLTALMYHEKGLDTFKTLKDTASIARSYNNIGVIYLYLSDYPRALEAFLQTLSLTEDDAGSGDALANIGLVYKNLENYPQALHYHRQALSIYRTAGNLQGEANTLGNIGTALDLMGRPTEALDAYQQALSINTKIGNKRRIAGDLTNIGVVYTGTGDYAKAEDFLNQAVAMYEHANAPANQSIALLYLAEVAEKKNPTGSLRQQGLHKALQLQQKALGLAQQAGALERESEAWLSLSSTYEKTGKPLDALEAYRTHIGLRDSIYGAEKKQEITRMQLQFDYDKKEAILKAEFAGRQALAQQEIRRQKDRRNALGIGTAMLLVFTVAGYILYKKRRDADQQSKEAAFKAQVVETEMKALRAQMNPHFIFNSLNAISNFIGRNNLQAADDYLARFAGMMRMILENSEHREVSLADDLKALECYIDLECMRLGNSFRYEIEIDSNLDPENTMVPPLILQPFVENSIWHGLSGKKEGGKISIRIRGEDDLLCCTVEDNGTGYLLAEHKTDIGLQQKRSMGTRITESRIAIAGRSANKEGGVLFTNLQQGLRVDVRLPLELSF